MLGSDLAYDERSIEALVAAVTKHLAPGGQARACPPLLGFPSQLPTPTPRLTQTLTLPSPLTLTLTKACLVNVRNRDGPPAAASAAFVEQLQRSDEGEVVVEEAALVNNYEKTDLFVLTFTKRQDV